MSPRLAGGGDRRSPLGLTKKILLSALVVGLLSTVTYHRVSASLSSESSNRNASTASGTLAIGNTVYNASLVAGTQCQSWKAGTTNNLNATCDALSWNPLAGLRFPGQIVKAYVAIQNAGSLRAAQLQLKIPSCTTTITTGTPFWVFAGTGGAGDPCNAGLEMYVQETTDATFATDKTCVYPQNYYVTPATDCANLAGSPATNWVQDSFSDLATISCWDLGPMTANTTRYFMIALRYDPVAANNLQGKMPVFTLRWHLYGNNLTYDTGGHPAGSSCQNPSNAAIGQ